MREQLGRHDTLLETWIILRPLPLTIAYNEHNLTLLYQVRSTPDCCIAAFAARLLHCSMTNDP